MTIAVTPIYAALIGVLAIALSVYVVRLRVRFLAASGDAGQKLLARAIRAHGNFSEYAPIGLILLFAAEFAGSSDWILHVVGAALVIGRILHALAFAWGWRHFQLRQAGMALTYASLGLSSLSAFIFSIV